MAMSTNMVYRHLCNFWPLVPALDLQRVADVEATELDCSRNFNSTYIEVPFFFYQAQSTLDAEKNFSLSDAKPEFNCLIIGDGIGCLLKTMSRMFRHNSSNLNIYKVSAFHESLTRDLLFLCLFGDTSLKCSLLERAETFLEIFGNTLLRSSSKFFVDSKSAEILDKLGRLDENERILPFLSTNHLKQKEIDGLVRVLTYLKDGSESFCIGKSWENALRCYYGTRYDSRRNIYDYHFNMKLEDYRMIGLKKYIDWCDTGIAFRFRQSKYNFPNKTMRIKPSDEGCSDDVYTGDIATSPFVAFGVETGNVSMLKTVNGEYQSNSEVISKFNILDMIHEFLSHIKDKSSKNLVVHLLFFETFCKMQGFANFFDAVYVCCDMMPRVESLLSTILKENGVVVFETIKNVVNSTKKQKEMYLETVHSLANSNGLEMVKDTVLNSNSNYKVFVSSKSKDSNVNNNIECSGANEQSQ